MPIVFTPLTEPIEVDDDEAASMARQGLLRDNPPEPPAPPEMVTSPPCTAVRSRWMWMRRR